MWAKDAVINLHQSLTLKLQAVTLALKTQQLPRQYAKFRPAHLQQLYPQPVIRWHRIVNVLLMMLMIMMMLLLLITS